MSWHLEHQSRCLRQRRLAPERQVRRAADCCPALSPPAVPCGRGRAGPSRRSCAGSTERHRGRCGRALTGNPEALVRGLVKVHAMARIPRRWDADLERHLSHPSLKRRIQDIRAAAGTPPAALGDTAVFESSDGAARAVFGGDSLEWIEGTSASRLGHDRLRSCGSATRLVRPACGDGSQRQWQMPLRSKTSRVSRRC